MSMDRRPEIEKEEKMSPAGKEKPLTAAEIALQKGTERREKIGKFFNSLKDRISSGVDKGATYALGAPEAVAHAGGKAWDTMTESTGRFFDRVDSAAVRLEDRVVKGLESATNKVADLGKRTAAYGLNTFVAPVENGIKKIFTLPAGVQEWRASRAEKTAQRAEAEAQAHLDRQKQLMDGPIEARILALMAEIQRLRTETEANVSRAEGVRDAARRRAQELRASAQRRKAKIGQFSLVRQALGAGA